MKSIFSYIDYRYYLRDYYNEKKQSTRYFSTRYFAKKAGLSSASFLREVINGKKNLTNNSIEKFVKALDLSEKEGRFFKHLVLFNQSNSADDKQEHYAVLLSLMNTIKEHRLTVQQHQVYNYWYIPVIRELVCILDFKDDFNLLAKSVYPPVSTREAKSAVTLLVRLNMLEKSENGMYVQTKKAIAAKSELDAMAIFNFTRAMAEKAVYALDTLKKEDRNFSTITGGMSRACYDIILAELHAFKERVVTIINNDEITDTSEVYQLNFQIFPVSAGNKTKGKK